MRKLDQPEQNEFYTAHSLYAISMRGILQACADFIDSHDQEVLFLDFNHIYEFTCQQDHQEFHDLVFEILGQDRILKSESGYLPKISLKNLQNSGHNFVIFYDNLEHLGSFFRNDNMPAPWPRQITGPGLYDFCETLLHVEGRPVPTDTYNPMFVSQYVMTPDASVVLKQPLSSLKNWEQAEYRKAPLKNWLSIQHADDVIHGINVVTTDFIDADRISDIVRVNFRIF